MKLLLILALVSFSAYSSFDIDPYVGTGSHVTSYDAIGAGGNISDATNSMTAVGARVGYGFLLLSAGLDVQMASVDGSNINSTSVYVGLDLPILLRFWGEYFLSSEAENLTFKDGYSIGAGFTGLPFVSINLEAQTINYELEQSGFKYDVASAAYLLSVSLPLSF